MPTKRTEADETLQKNRRERVATACLQALVASNPPNLAAEAEYEEQLRVRAAVAIDLADELIEQLNDEESEDEDEEEDDDGDDEDEGEED